MICSAAFRQISVTVCFPEFRVSNKSLNELTMRVGRLEGAAMHAIGSTLFGEELEDSEGSRRQFEVRYDAPKKNDQESA